MGAWHDHGQLVSVAPLSTSAGPADEWCRPSAGQLPDGWLRVGLGSAATRLRPRYLRPVSIEVTDSTDENNVTTFMVPPGGVMDSPPGQDVEITITGLESGCRVEVTPRKPQHADCPGFGSARPI